MLGEHAADDVFVDIDAKRACDLQCDARTADTRIAAFELDNRADELPSMVLLGRAVDDIPRRKASDICAF